MQFYTLRINYLSRIQSWRKTGLMRVRIGGSYAGRLIFRILRFLMGRWTLMRNINDDPANLYPLFVIFCTFGPSDYIFRLNTILYLNFHNLFTHRLLILNNQSTCYCNYLKWYVLSVYFLRWTGYRCDSLNFLKFPCDVILVNFFPWSDAVAWKMINTDNLKRTLFVSRLKLFLIWHEHSLIKILITSE